MKFQELPEIPNDWIDFISGRCPGLPGPPIPFDREFLHSHLDRVKQGASRFQYPVQEAINESSLCSTHAGESILRLQQSDAVAIVANIEAGVLGGALSQFLKCLTAIKVSRKLAGYGINAVPVCWIHTPRSAVGDSPGMARILDARSDLHRLRLAPEETIGFQSEPILPSNQVSWLIDRIEEIGRDSYDPEILEILKSSYTRDATWSSACAALIPALVNEWGIVSVDSEAPDFQSKLYAGCMSLLHEQAGKNRSPERHAGLPVQADIAVHKNPQTPSTYFIQGCILPVFARILDPYEVSSYMDVQSGFESVGLVPPICWPSSSVTVIDARRRKILEKYAIALQDLFKGEEAVLNNLKERVVPSSIETNLVPIKSEIERYFDDLNDPGMEGKSFRKAKNRCRERVVYQLDKIRNRVETIKLEKREVMKRRIQRACGFLAPDGIRQEIGLTGIAFPLRYSRSIISFLYENLDIIKFEHQLINLE